MCNNATNRKISGDSWILVPSVTPSDVKASTELTQNTTLETKIISSTPLITLSATSDNITNEVELDEETAATDKIIETTFEPTSSEEQEDSSEYIGVTGSSSEYPFDSEEDEATTIDNVEPDVTNVNITSPILTQPGNKSCSQIIAPHFRVVSLFHSNHNSHHSLEISHNLSLYYLEMTTTSPTTLFSSNMSSTSELSPAESMSAVNPGETTVLPVTQKTNETEEAISPSESSTEENLSRLNETSSMSYETSSAANLEGIDYKLSEKRTFKSTFVTSSSIL